MADKKNKKSFGLYFLWMGVTPCMLAAMTILAVLVARGCEGGDGHSSTLPADSTAEKGVSQDGR